MLKLNPLIRQAFVFEARKKNDEGKLSESKLNHSMQETWLNCSGQKAQDIYKMSVTDS